MTTATQLLPSVVTNAGGNILSVYLDVDQSNANNLNKGYEDALKSRLKTIAEGLTQNVEGKDFNAAAALVQDFVANHKLLCKALVVFADSSRILFSRELHVNVPTDLQWGKPQIATYAETLDEFERYIIVVTNKWRARILSVRLGSVELSTEFQDIPHTTHIHATGSDRLETQSQDQRRADENMKKHLKHLVHSLEEILATHPADRVVLGGNVEAVAELFRLLPGRIQAKTVGTVHSDLSDDFEKTIQRTTDAYLKSERDSEARSVASLLEHAGDKHKAVTGVTGTLDAIREKRVSSLYYVQGLKVPGKVCASCGALFSAETAGPCTSCSSHLEEKEDLLNLILIATVTSGARIEQVRGAAAEALDKVGGIGATLRF